MRPEILAALARLRRKVMGILRFNPGWRPLRGLTRGYFLSPLWGWEDGSAVANWR